MGWHYRLGVLPIQPWLLAQHWLYNWLLFSKNYIAAFHVGNTYHSLRYKDPSDILKQKRPLCPLFQDWNTRWLYHSLLLGIWVATKGLLERKEQAACLYHAHIGTVQQPQFKVYPKVVGENKILHEICDTIGSVKVRSKVFSLKMSCRVW
ncbi:hypothetical protein BDBG_17469 [Blastomyces gilchristii SLH14081]|uniref:Uncharacterized protein n=1 Tax=Blastomyces gilchristii (strain SLH14081) TaxID=559298 RepID=A0A179UVP5_BLAGS|nr:uncharacterized protein BDBG_17469 [Blastomyces gilchristii SLH14081]OAT11218.1 hypothetical protein BDBG_17469 [Blastomyces gilchristii SLH14081]